MKTRIVHPEQLSRHELHAWSEMARTNPCLQSPFFMPEFARAVGAVHSGVRVLVIEDDETPVAFLPFQEERKGRLVAVGGSLNDFQGVICAGQTEFSLTDVLRQAEISKLHVRKVVDWQNELSDHVIRRCSSPYIDLAGGYRAWETALLNRGSERLKQLARKQRKLARECGPLKFQFHTVSENVLRQLISWKKDQYNRTREIDIFSSAWVKRLLNRLLRLPANSPLQPVLSAMYAGDALVAAHYGLINNTVCHWWFPGYDPKYGKYSPGKLLVLRILEHCANSGITRFDFGVGDEPYKYAFANASSEVCSAVIDHNPARRCLRRHWHQTLTAVKDSSLGPWLCDVRNCLKNLIDENGSGGSGLFPASLRDDRCHVDRGVSPGKRIRRAGQGEMREEMVARVS